MDLRLGRDTFGDTRHAGQLMDLAEAHQLLREWVLNPRLLFHMEQVGHLMKCWASERGYSEEAIHLWHLAGLLHDADWDQYPEQHCAKIIAELERREQDPALMRAIASHGPRYFGVEPQSELDKMLYAFDELSGLIHAYSLMRPEGYTGMEVKGVKKRLKDKTFAAQVSRADIQDAVGRLSINLEELIQFIIDWQLQTPEVAQQER
ncbi:MAG: HD domain-containing protein [Nitritalea sp.]